MSKQGTHSLHGTETAASSESTPRLSLEQLSSLVRSAQKNKDLHFAAFYQAAWPQVYYLIYGMLGNETDAQDGAQQTFLKIFESLGNLKDPQAAAAWINRIALNVARDALINRNETTQSDQSLEDRQDLLTEHAYDSDTHTNFIPGQELEDRERDELIFETTQTLPTTLREVLMLHYWDEFSLSQIAETLHLSENAVSVRLYRARKQLKNALESLEREGQLARFTLATFGFGSALKRYATHIMRETPAWIAPPLSSTGSGSTPTTNSTGSTSTPATDTDPTLSTSTGTSPKRPLKLTPKQWLTAGLVITAVLATVAAIAINYRPANPIEAASNAARPKQSREATDTGNIILSEEEQNSSGSEEPTTPVGVDAYTGSPKLAKPTPVKSKNGSRVKPGMTTASPKPKKPKPAPTPATPKVGDRVQLGTYQSEPLIWRILTLNKTTALLLSDKVLIAGAYRSDWQALDASDYLTSDARAWLVANQPPELASLTLPNTEGDRWFLPTAAQITAALSKPSARKAVPHPTVTTTTGYSGQALSTVSGYANWWLRTEGTVGSEVQLIDPYGELTSDLSLMAVYGIRPATALDLSKASLTKNGKDFVATRR